jgi:filamentous hemagglutinin
MGVGSIFATGGAAGILSNGSTLSSVLADCLKDETPKTLASYALSAGFERYAVSKGVSASDASKASNTLGATGVRDTLVDNAGDIFKRD